MLENLGDEVTFFPDQYYEKDWNLCISFDEVKNFDDVTEEYINKAEKLAYIKGRIKDILDEDEPEIFLWRFDSSDF